MTRMMKVRILDAGASTTGFVSGLLCLVLLSASLAQSACGEAEATRRFLTTLDDAAVISAQARVYIEFLVDSKKISPQKGLAVLALVDRLDAVDKAVLTESRSYIVIENNRKVLRLNASGKVNLTRQAESFRDVANSLINDQVFLDLTGEDRARWTAISNNLTALITRSIDLVGRIKTI